MRSNTIGGWAWIVAGAGCFRIVTRAIWSDESTLFVRRMLSTRRFPASAIDQAKIDETSGFGGTAAVLVLVLANALRPEICRVTFFGKGTAAQNLNQVANAINRWLGDRDRTTEKD